MAKLLLEHTFYIKPMPTRRGRNGGRHVYSDPEYKAHKAELIADLKKHFGYFCWDFPESNTKERRKFFKENRYALALRVYTVRYVGDMDNYSKVVKDALQQAGVIPDDKLIDDYKEPYGKRVDKENPRIEMKLYQLTKKEMEN